MSLNKVFAIVFIVLTLLTCYWMPDDISRYLKLFVRDETILSNGLLSFFFLITILILKITPVLKDKKSLSKDVVYLIITTGFICFITSLFYIGDDILKNFGLRNQKVEDLVALVLIVLSNLYVNRIHSISENRESLLYKIVISYFWVVTIYCLWFSISNIASSLT